MKKVKTYPLPSGARTTLSPAEREAMAATRNEAPAKPKAKTLLQSIRQISIEPAPSQFANRVDEVLIRRVAPGRVTILAVERRAANASPHATASNTRTIATYLTAASDRDQAAMARAAACEIFGVKAAGSQPPRGVRPLPVANCTRRDLDHLLGLFRLVANETATLITTDPNGG